jgi:hypothetical protein
VTKRGSSQKATKDKASKSDPVDLARARRAGSKAPVEPSEKTRRVHRIATMMLAGEWNNRASHKALAAEWGCAVPTVRGMAAEASRLCDLTTNQRAKLVEISRLRLFEVSQQDEPDRVTAARTLLESLGELRQRNLVTEEVDPLTSWTDAELDEFAKSGKVPERSIK